VKLCGFIALQAAFDINNDSDAEVSLQIANALTLALLSYRMTMMPSLVCLCSYGLVFMFLSKLLLLLALLPLLLFHHYEYAVQNACVATRAALSHCG